MTKYAHISFGFMRPTYSPRCVFSEEHMDMYVDWLQNSCKMDSIQHANAPFPTAREFNAFIRAQGPRYPQAIQPCQHPRHPLDTSSTKYCPVCFFKMHVNYIKFIDVAWQKKGAPWVGNKADQAYTEMKHARSIARMVLANDMDFVESLAKRERDWNEHHPSHDTSKTYSYCRVLDMYHKWMDSKPAVPRNIRRPDRKITFKNDTPDFTVEKRRPPELWRRRSPHYTAGRHASPSTEGWEDTSGSSSYVSMLMQCKLYMVQSAEHMAETSSIPRNAIYVGLLGNYDHQAEIVAHIERMHQQASNPQGFVRGLKNSDAIFVLKREVEVHDSRKEITIADVRPVALEQDAGEPLRPSQWDVKSDPGDDEMDWE
ncbi:hypothetical protein CC80DRAFT_551235 [Byssothecium circinans]|uniref:Uncharacterized protein n=1 Tax=Byssothecium circinans TaxID=147558 RepID=A0A6A5TNQ3_9PLEO|nr:hypothetical protein CC80DRAFT_551235 [Byssothecium circinans]